MRLNTLKLAAVLAAIGCAGANAEAIDGKKPLICASFVAVSCGTDGECSSGTAQNAGLPEFFRVDLAGAAVRAARTDGSSLVTKIERTNADDNQIVVQGSEAGRAWSATLDKSNGRMVLTVSGDREAFAVFGSCTAP